jgi:DNA-binding NarL/FixJ family response regulator
MSRPRVLLADDHTLVLEGLRRILVPEFDLVGTAEDGRALVESAAKLKPDVIVLDISMPLLNGIDAARQIMRATPGAKLIFLTMHADATYVSAAFGVGASGYLLKRSAASELSTAIHQVLEGGKYLTPVLAAEVQDFAIPESGCPATTAGGLTNRQREVLQLVAEGRSAKEIAAILGISVKTVEFHRSNITEKLGIRTTAELTKYAIEHGIVTT